MQQRLEFESLWLLASVEQIRIKLFISDRKISNSDSSTLSFAYTLVLIPHIANIPNTKQRKYHSYVTPYVYNNKGLMWLQHIIVKIKYFRTFIHLYSYLHDVINLTNVLNRFSITTPGNTRKGRDRINTYLPDSAKYVRSACK